MADKQRYSLRDVKRTLRKHTARLLAHPNVLYLAIGEKISAGTGQKRLAIRICVSQKRGKGYRDAVPQRLRAVKPDGTLANFYIPTDVEKKPRTLKALGLRGGDTIRGTTLGSIGLVFTGTPPNDHEFFILTNAHVTPGIDQRAQEQLIHTGEGQTVGNTFRATRLLSAPGKVHKVDAALIRPSVPVDPFLIDGHLTAVEQYGDLAAGMTQQFFYLRQNGARRVFAAPNQIVTARPVRMGRHDLRFVDFFEMTLTRGQQAEPGDSGSVLVSDNGRGLVVHALLFAGMGNTIGVMSIQRVFKALEDPHGDVMTP